MRHSAKAFLNLLKRFNPRTHTGCDDYPGRIRSAYWVSIHAPTRGATSGMLDGLPGTGSFNPRTHTGCDLQTVCALNFGFVSIHAPTRGATNPSSGSSCVFASFQSTHPHGVRHPGGQIVLVVTKVSIHAPTRGATVLFPIRTAQKTSFNPRTHTGCDIFL